MINKEIIEKIKLYESKWGRLGHTNIMKPELNHSGIEGGNAMSSIANDLIKFRQKVAAGREANKRAHISTINVTDLNRRYYEDITTNGTLIHAGGSDNQRYGSYYHKLDDYYGKGKHRYFATKDEYDAYIENKNNNLQNWNKEVNDRRQVAEDERAHTQYENYANKLTQALQKNTSDNYETRKAKETKENNAKKEVSKQRSGMEGYDDWKKGQNQKEVAKQRSGMEGYDDWKNSDSKAKERKLTENNIKNMKADVVEQYSKIARESDAKTAAKEFYKEDAVSELLDEIGEGFKSGKLRYKDGKFETDDKKIQDNIDAFSDNIQKWTTEIGKKSGKGRDVQKELEKLITSEIEKMSKKSPEAINGSRDASMDAQEKAKKAAEENREANERRAKSQEVTRSREEAEKEGHEKAQNLMKKEMAIEDDESDKVLRRLILDINTLTRADNGKSDFYDKLKKEFGDELHRDSSTGHIEYHNKEIEDKIKKVSNEWKELNNDRGPNGEIKNIDKMNALSKEWADLEHEMNKEKNSKIMSAIYNVIESYPDKEKKKIYRNLNLFINSPSGGLNNIIQDDNKASKDVKEFFESLGSVEEIIPKNVKHSSEEPEEIMDEYSAFMERVKRGKEKNRLAHSTFISPADLNARYEQSIRDHCFLVHGGNFKYYNKIDLPNGQKRYFYTKAEWDAYQEGLGRTAYEEQKKSNNESKDTGKYSEIAKNDPKKAASEYLKSDKVNKLLDTIEKGVKSGAIKMNNDNNFVAGDNAEEFDKYRKEIESYTKDIENDAKKIDGAAGSGNNFLKQVTTMIRDESDNIIERSESGDETNKYANIAKDDPKKAASEFMKDPVVTDYINFVEKGLKNGSIRMNNDGNFVSNNTGKTGDKDIVDSYMYKIDDIAEKIASSSGAGNKFLSEVYRLIQDQSDALDDKYSK